jgi:hypothetical protein
MTQSVHRDPQSQEKRSKPQCNSPDMSGQVELLFLPLCNIILASNSATLPWQWQPIERRPDRDNFRYAWAG